MTRVGSAVAALLSAGVRGTGAAAELAEADQLLRTALPLSRRVGCVAAAGGSGTSTTAAALANVLAARRAGMVLAVDAAGGASGLTWLAGASAETGEPVSGQPMSGQPASGQPAAGQAASAQAAAQRRRTARTAAEARTGLPSSGSGAAVLDLTRGDGRAAPVAAWGRDVAPVSRFFDLVVTDWGVRPAPEELAEVAATSHVVLVVSRADRHSADAAAALVPQLRAAASPPQVLLVLVDVGRTADRLAPATRPGPEVVTVGHQPARAAAVPPGSRELGARARRDQILLAARVVAAAVRPATPVALALALAPAPADPPAGTRPAPDREPSSTAAPADAAVRLPVAPLSAAPYAGARARGVDA